MRYDGGIELGDIMPDDYDADQRLAMQEALAQWNNEKLPMEGVSDASPALVESELGTGAASTFAMGVKEDVPLSEQVREIGSDLQESGVALDQDPHEYSPEFQAFMQSSLDEKGGMESNAANLGQSPERKADYERAEQEIDPDK